MKKLIALLLVAVMCLSLVACGGGETQTDSGNSSTQQNGQADDKSAEKTIIGEWKSLGGDITVFREDGTGTAPNGNDFSWKYEKDMEWYMMSLGGMTFSTEIKTDNGIRFFVIEGIAYYHADDYEKAIIANKTTESTEAEIPLIVMDWFDNPCINLLRFPEIVETIELTIDNWRDYIKVYSYSYDEERITTDAFGEIVSTETITHTGIQLGAGNERYHQFYDVVIELKDVSTGGLITFNFLDQGLNENRLPKNFDLDDYECTRIKGFIFFVDVPEEAIHYQEPFYHNGYYCYGYFDVGNENSPSERFYIYCGTNAIGRTTTEIADIVKP